MIIKPNPEYKKARFELKLIDRDGNVMPNDFYTLRFTDSNIERAIELMRASRWTELKDLSISPFIEL